MQGTSETANPGPRFGATIWEQNRILYLYGGLDENKCNHLSALHLC